MDLARVVDELVAEPPAFHLSGSGELVSYAVSTPLLRLLGEVVSPGSATIETGAGSSTVVFAAAGADHVAISPAPDEEARIRAWCAEHGVDARGYTHLCGESVAVLPTLDRTIDVALVDGDHAYPVPAIDWYYCARRLRAGGVIILDDLQLWPCREVASFLEEERGWERLARTRRFAAFRALEPGSALTGRWWGQQARVRRLGDGSLRARLRGRVRQIVR